MRKICLLLLIIGIMAMPVSALDMTAPPVPQDSERFMPEPSEDFGKGLMEILRNALGTLRPDLHEALRVCVQVIASVMIVSILRLVPSMKCKAGEIAGAVAVAGVLLRASGSLIQLGVQTVWQISQYGKMLLPVMASALASQGGISGSAALYAGTTLFDALLGSLIEGIITPLIYLYLALGTASAALGDEMLKRMCGVLKSGMIWLLKTVLYVFTGYISITGVVSGTTDAAALKAAKLTISGTVPVVGGILSDASEAILVTAGTVKNAAGLYGMFAIVAIWIGPFLRIGVHYLILKLTGAVCAVFGSQEMTGLIEDFSCTMGLLLGMTGSVCLMLMVSLVCFMKGVG